MNNKYKNFQIETWYQGFSPDANLIRISCYIVKNSDYYCLFIFGDPLLKRMANPDISEEEIETQQFELIKEKIDNESLENYEEYIFQYYGHNYLEENNVHWWKKSLKNQAREQGLLKDN